MSTDPLDPLPLIVAAAKHPVTHFDQLPALVKAEWAQRDPDNYREAKYVCREAEARRDMEARSRQLADERATERRRRPAGLLRRFILRGGGE